MLQIQSQDAMEAAVAADDKDKLQEALQADEAQVCHACHWTARNTLSSSSSMHVRYTRSGCSVFQLAVVHFLNIMF